MDAEIAKRIMDIQDQAREDEQYRKLLEDYEVSNARFCALLETLTEEQRQIAADFLGVSFAMHLRLLELAVG